MNDELNKIISLKNISYTKSITTKRNEWILMLLTKS